MALVNSGMVFVEIDQNSNVMLLGRRRWERLQLLSGLGEMFVKAEKQIGNGPRINPRMNQMPAEQADRLASGTWSPRTSPRKHINDGRQ